MRNELRFLANALARLADEHDNKTEASLRDISEHGLSIKSEDFIDVEPNSVYEITVIPEEETKIKEFRLKIESRWIKLNRSRMESGFSILISSESEDLKTYLDYLAKNSKEDAAN